MVIYRLISPSNKSYVGLTYKTIEHRLKEHIYSWRSGNYACKKLSQAFDKYPPETWKYEALFYTEYIKEARQKEVDFIKALDSINNGYNILPGGEINRLGIPSSEEAKKKMSYARLGAKNPQFGKKHTMESRLKMSKSSMGGKSRLGMPHSEESKRKMSLANLGKIPWNKGIKTGPVHNRKKVSEETRKKMSKARLGKRPWNFGKKISK